MRTGLVCLSAEGSQQGRLTRGCHARLSARAKKGERAARTARCSGKTSWPSTKRKSAQGAEPSWRWLLAREPRLMTEVESY